jgi:hypothetical protein
VGPPFRPLLPLVVLLRLLPLPMVRPHMLLLLVLVLLQLPQLLPTVALHNRPPFQQASLLAPR